MPIEEVKTIVSVGPTYGKKVGNLTLEGAQFFGRPNFTGELNRFGDDRRTFTVLIPNDLADQLREMGWNVKTNIPTKEQEEQGYTVISHLKVFLNFGYAKGHEGDPDYETGPEITIFSGEQQEQLTSKTVAILDRARFETIDMEIRAWEYNPEEHPGQYSARLVKLVARLIPNRLDEKWGRLGG